MKLIILLALTMCVNSIYVNTNYGSVHGMLDPIDPDVEVFLGIPYAKPPIGSLRWEKPLPIDHWGELNASSFGQFCMQPSLFGPMPPERMNEDCLYLNIYRPTGNLTDLPVMIYIHGGALIMGSGEDYPGNWLAKKNVIVVNFNYRLGIFGFGNSGDKTLPGNYGLLDQHEAIAFTKKIIASFGGNPQNITIFGESAGGTSVVMQLISPLSKGLIQKGISQSGAFVFDEPGLVSEKCLKDVCNFLSPNCIKSNYLIENVIKILKNATAQELLDAVNNSSYTYFYPVPNDGIFFPTDARETIMSKNITCYDFIGGWTNRDGANIIPPSMNLSNATDLQAVIDSTWTHTAMGGKFNQRQTEDAFDHYDQSTSPLGWEKFFLDGMFVRHALLMADALMSSGCDNTYVYQFSYNVPGTNYLIPPGGAAHGTDLFYLFPSFSYYGGAYIINRTLSEDEQKLSNQLLLHWTRFAYGLPLEDWPKYNTQRSIYNIINATKFNILSDYSEREFWISLLKNLDPTEGPPTQKPEESDAASVCPRFALYFTILLGIISYHILQINF